MVLPLRHFNKNYLQWTQIWVDLPSANNELYFYEVSIRNDYYMTHLDLRTNAGTVVSNELCLHSDLSSGL